MTYRLIVLFVVTLMCTFIMTACETTLGHETPIIIVEDKAPPAYRFTGSIDHASAQRLEFALLTGEFSTIELNSAGGVVHLAVRLADLIRVLQISTTVKSGESCASACVTLLMAGVGRSVEDGSHIGIHSPYVKGNRLEELTTAEVFRVAQEHVYWYMYSNLALVKPEQRLTLLALFLTAHRNSNHDTLYWLTREELENAGIID